MFLNEATENVVLRHSQNDMPLTTCILCGIFLLLIILLNKPQYYTMKLCRKQGLLISRPTAAVICMMTSNNFVCDDGLSVVY